MSLFSNVKIYAGNWNVKSVDKLEQADKDAIKNVVTTSSDYGISACFFLKRGGQFYIPMSRDANVGVGEVLDVDKIEVITLEKDGENDIQRINVVG
jgi:hypothetical protein